MMLIGLACLSLLVLILGFGGWGWGGLFVWLLCALSWLIVLWCIRRLGLGILGLFRCMRIWGFGLMLGVLPILVLRFLSLCLVSAGSLAVCITPILYCRDGCWGFVKAGKSTLTNPQQPL